MADRTSAFESSHNRIVPEQTAAKPQSSKTVPQIARHGITVLHVPENESSIVADIVFVHGLGGHPQDTWQFGNQHKAKPDVTEKRPKWKLFKSKEPKTPSQNESMSPTGSQDQAMETDVGSAQRSSCLWPFHLVPMDFENVRVMTYGYDSHPTHFYKGGTQQTTITDHSEQLLKSVTNCRSHCTDRALIFIAHSLGGILVKDAMVISNAHPQSHMRDVSLSCRYIVFFGTPHQGANIASYGETLAAVVGALPLAPKTYKEILHGLRPDSEKLRNVTTTFNNLLDSKTSDDDKIFLYSFREGMAMTNLNTPGGKVLSSKVVSDTSSFFNRQTLEETSVVPANHREMCKFDTARHVGYQDFQAALTRHLKRLQAPITLAEQREIHNRQLQEREETQHHEWEQMLRLQQQQQNAAAVIGMLDFGERVQRQQAIADLMTSKATFDWVWQTPFSDWLASAYPLFWINGKPGSGKSTLMNYIAVMEEERIEDTISQYSGRPVRVIHHFFDFRADGGLGNDFKGFVRSLLVQMIKRHPDLVEKAPRLSRIADKVNKSTYSEVRTHETAVTAEDLVDAFRAVPDILFVALDGLDEYAGNRFELVSFIKILSRCSHVKLCVASRPEAPFPDLLSDVPSLEMHQCNADGILEFAIEMFDSACSLHFLSDSELRHRLAEQIVEQSFGVFIWARFAVLEILSGISEGRYDRNEDLVSAVNDLPDDLETLYGRIVGRLSKQDRAFARLALLYMLEAQNTLRLGMLQNLFELHHLEKSHWTATLGLTDGLFKDISQFERRLLASTNGFIEIHDDRDIVDESEPEDETESPSDSISHEELDATEANNRTAEFATVDAHETGDGGDAGDDAETALQLHSVTDDSRISDSMSDTQPQSSNAAPIRASATVQLLHRTVKTYLERSGWAELSQSLNDLSRDNALWLQSCVTIINQHEVYMQSFPRAAVNGFSPFNYKEPRDVFYDLRRHHHDATQNVQKSLSIGMHFLLAYALTYMPHHAKLFEDTAGQSSYGVLSDTFRSSFWYMHFEISEDDEELCYCKHFDSKRNERSLTILQVAVSHSLDSFIGEYLEAVAVAKAPSTAPRNTSLDRGSQLQHSLGWLRSRHMADIDPMASRDASRGLAIVQTFDDISCPDEKLGTLRLALEYGRKVTDDELLMAMTRSDIQVVKLLLKTRPSGKLILVTESSVRQCLTELRAVGETFTHKRLIKGICRDRLSVRPFHAIGIRRSYNAAAIQHTNSVVELFLARGEDINEHCSPFGTVLHSFIDAKIGFHDDVMSEFLGLLLSKGAEINATGPFGTALEFAWMLGNTELQEDIGFYQRMRVRECCQLINDLLDRGGTNNKADPNGIVPSIKRMRDFGKSLNKFAEARRFYEHGPLQPGQAAARWKDLYPNDDRGDADVEPVKWP